MGRRMSTRPHLFTIGAAILLHAAGAAHVHAADAPSGVITSDTPLSGCKLQALNDDFYPRAALLRSISGRALALMERSPEGRVKIVRIAISNPPEIFERAISRFVARFKCAPIADARQFTLSVSFTIDPAPEFPHFDGADEQISVRGQLIPRGRAVGSSSPADNRAS